MASAPVAYQTPIRACTALAPLRRPLLSDLRVPAAAGAALHAVGSDKP